MTAVSMLPGGWLLAAGDAEGSLSCTDLRMMGGSSGGCRQGSGAAWGGWGRRGAWVELHVCVRLWVVGGLSLS